MLLAMLAFVLSLVSMVSGAAFVPIRLASPAASVSSDCAAPSITTVYVPTTIISPPETITIAVENMTSVSESLSRVASIDTVQVSDENGFAPVSDAPNTIPTEFTHTIVAPLIEATIAINTSSGVYYVSIGNNTTDWNYTPAHSTAVGTTTVTVSPVPALPTSRSSVNLTTTIRTTTHITRTVTQSAPYPMTNGTQVSTLVGGASGSGVPSVTYNSTTTKWIHNHTVTRLTTVATTTIYMSSHPTTISITNATQTANLTATITQSSLGYSGTNATWANTYDKRQVCTLVYAVISGHLASWCNNWDGHSAFHHSTYSSTVTPSQYATETTSTEVSTTSTDTIPTTMVSSVTATVTEFTASVLPNSATSTFSALAAASSCGQVGNFEINFDGLPVYSPPNNNTASFPPIFNPYAHFFWGNGWAYGPPPSEPFPPQSGDRLAEFVPSLANNDTNSPDASTVPENAFGAGPRAYNNNYWFNALSAYVGCDNGATDLSVTCDFVATAYQWDPVNYKEKVVATEHFPQPPCPGFKTCALQQIIFDSRFVNLSSLSFYANVQGQVKIFWVDTIELSWVNNTCAAGLARISAQ